MEISATNTQENTMIFDACKGIKEDLDKWEQLIKESESNFEKI
jgi:hypothetical protein